MEHHHHDHGAHQQSSASGPRDAPQGARSHADDTSLNRTALSATVHCLTGCAIGEVLGMVVGTAFNLANWVTVVLAVALAFIFGYSLTMLPLVRSGLGLKTAAALAFASDTASIALMEVVDNVIMVFIPGAMEAGLGALLVVSKPAEGNDDASLLSWAVIGGATVGLAVFLFVLARGRTAALRAGLLGTASGILFGLSAALTKTTVSLLDEGILAVFGDWHVYALAGVSAAAFWLEQAALQTGALAAAVATTMAFDPLSSLVFGIALFDEALHESVLGYALSALALAAALAGLVILARAKGEESPPTSPPEPAPALA